MGNIFGILLIFIELVVFVVAANRLALFFNKVWRHKEFDSKLIGQFIFAIIIFVAIFFTMKQYPEFFEFKVSQARSATQKTSN